MTRTPDWNRREGRSGEIGTREYPASTDEYSSGEEIVSGAGSRDRTPDTQSAEAAREALRSLPPWWEREGYASLAEVLAEQESIDDRVMGRKQRDLRRLSLKEVIFSEPEPEPRKRRKPRVRPRQVNVKLTDEEHSKLQEVARTYGLAPATLARAFVVRATDVALKDRADA